MTDYRDRNKPITAEDLIRRYNFDDIAKIKVATQSNKKGLDQTNTIMTEFIEATTEDLQELQDQVDGNITTWFFNGVPTLLNEPAVNWTTDTEKNNHLGDLYYDQDTGYAYRFALSGSTYQWLKITDSDVTEALAIANAAQDTADSKRRVFVNQPIPPYDIGDLWIRGDQDLYRCSRARDTGSFDASDFVLATNYTDDTVATQALGVANQTAQNLVANYVTNATLETTTQSINGEIQQISILVDEKSKIYTSQPSPPYNVGDVYVLNNKVYVCTTAKTEEQTYSENDWTLDIDTAHLVSDTTFNATTGAIEASVRELDATSAVHTNKIASMEVDIAEIKTEIGEIADITTSGESDYATIDLDGINQSEPIKIDIHPVVEDISYLYPKKSASIPKGNTTQNGTPTPSSPVPVNNVTGRQEIDIVGKNLANIENAKIGKSWNNSNYSQRATILYIPVKTNTQYTLVSSWTNENITNIRAVFNHGESDIANYNIPSSYPYNNAQWEYVSIEVIANTTFTNAMLDGVKIMLCEGEATIDNYEPYIGKQYEINLGNIELCKIENYQDYIYKDNNKWYIHKEIGKAVLNGSEDWQTDTWFTSTDSSTHFKLLSFNNYSSNYKPVICDKFNYVDNRQQNNGNVFTNLPAKFLLFSMNTISSVNNFKTWLSNNKPVVYYVLATATDTEITDEELINQLEALYNAGLFPSDTLFPKDRKIRFLNKTTSEIFDYLLPDDLLYYDSETYDRFVLDYENNICQIIKRVGYNIDGTKYLLDNPIIEDLTYPTIPLTTGDYTISLSGYATGYLFVRLMCANMYTSQFATRVELTSAITQTKDEIDLEVAKKVDEDKVISKINMSPERILLDSNRISLAGKDIDLTGDEVTISSTNFNVDKNGNIQANNGTFTNGTFSGQINARGGTFSGNITASGTISGGNISGANISGANISGSTINSNNGSIGGWVINSEGLSNGAYFIKNNGYAYLYTYADMVIIRSYILGEISFTDGMISHYDLNNDGRVDAADLLILQKRILGID